MTVTAKRARAATSLAPQAEARRDHLDGTALAAVLERVLWLSTAIVDHANRVRPNPGGLKVGGHQASSASIVSIMTALWFHALRPEDRVSVKPHASPVLHAINHLLGELDARLLDRLGRYRCHGPDLIFAYTVKGYGLATQGHPQNHSSLLTETQMRALATGLGSDLDDPWAPLPAGPAADLCVATATRLRRSPAAPAATPEIPDDLDRTPTGTGHTQQALGRARCSTSAPPHRHRRDRGRRPRLTLGAREC